MNAIEKESYMHFGVDELDLLVDLMVFTGFKECSKTVLQMS